MSHIFVTSSRARRDSSGLAGNRWKRKSEVREEFRSGRSSLRCLLTVSTFVYSNMEAGESVARILT